MSASSHVPTQWPSGAGQLVVVKSRVPLTPWFQDSLPRGAPPSLWDRGRRPWQGGSMLLWGSFLEAQPQAFPLEPLSDLMST